MPAPRDRSSSEPEVGVLALQGDVAEHLAALAEVGARGVEVRSGVDLDRIDGLIVPGGESTTISLLLEAGGMVEPLRKYVAARRPLFGTCAGMIVLASEVADGRADQHYFGAIDVAVRRNAFGRQRESFEADLDVLGLDEPVHAVFIRAPVVERCGPDVDVLATVDRRAVGGGEAEPVLCRQGSVLVSAFHPELTPDRRLHQLFVEAVAARLEAS